MSARMWGIIGGVALALALLSPLILGNSKKVERLFEDAEMSYERSDYEDAITKYKKALKESNKIAVNTEHIDKEFTTLANLKIAQCYYDLGEKTSDVRHYQNALTHIKKVALDTQIIKHKEELSYLWAENLYKIDDLDQSESKFSRLIENFPNSRWVPKALYTIGEINLKQGNRDAALNTFQKLVSEFSHSEFKAKAEQRIAELTPSTANSEKPNPNPDSMDSATYRTASDLKQEGKVHDAYQLCTDLITQYPDSEYVTYAYELIAEIHLDAKDHINARANYEEAMYSTADLERKKELYEAYHRTYLVPDPPNRNPRANLSDELFIDARLLRKEGRFSDAAEIYHQLANSTLPPEDRVYALYWAGRCYSEAALTDPTLFSKSVDAFKKLIVDYDSSSDTIKAYYHLAVTYTEWAKASGDQSKWQLVINRIDAANTRYGDNDDPTVQGWLSRMQELKEVAYIKLDDSSEPEPPIPPEPPRPSSVVLVNEGLVHFRRVELDAATQKARQALDLDPNYPPAQELLLKIKEKHYGRGWTFFDEGNYTKAISEFISAINIDPNFKEAHCHLGVIYIEKEMYTEAIKALIKAINIDQEFKEAHFNLALAHLELGEFEAAIDAANTALRIDSNYEPARMLIEFIAN